jgi:hypothetical protein
VNFTTEETELFLKKWIFCPELYTLPRKPREGGTRQSKAEDGRIRQDTGRQGPGQVETK